MANPRLLVAGIGNIFLGDDAFGVEVVKRLASRPLADAVRVIDFGIRGIDLTYALLDNYEAVILVDAVARGGEPGTLYVIEPEVADAEEIGKPDLVLQAHNLDPAQVLRLATALGSPVKRILLVGCEPAPLEADQEMRMELSEPVRQALDEALPLIERLVSEILHTVAC